MDKACEAILALQPVAFRYRPELHPGGITQFGLGAEQVEKVNPDLVARDDQGKPYSVRYEAVNAMLLNEFLKEHRKVELQQDTPDKAERRDCGTESNPLRFEVGAQGTGRANPTNQRAGCCGRAIDPSRLEQREDGCTG